MTAAVESLATQYPGKYRIFVETSCADVWTHNPHVGDTPPKDCRSIKMHYPNINKSHLVGNGHFMAAFCDYLSEQLEIKLPLTVNHPYLYLNEEEKKNPLEGLNYVVINAGVKQDYTCKGWGYANYQRVVDMLKERKLTTVQIGQLHHTHKPLKGAVNLLGKTTTRELFSLCYNARAGIGPTTFLQHIMAAFEKPYVCIVGGREPLNWLWYPTQVTMMTQGQLSCCSPNACWKSRVVKLEDQEGHDKSLCVLPVFREGEAIPKCMEMIKPEEVVRAIDRYIEGGKITLPDLTTSS